MIDFLEVLWKARLLEYRIRDGTNCSAYTDPAETVSLRSEDYDECTVEQKGQPIKISVVQRTRIRRPTKEGSLFGSSLEDSEAFE